MGCISLLGVYLCPFCLELVACGRADDSQGPRSGVSEKKFWGVSEASSSNVLGARALQAVLEKSDGV